MDVGVMCLITVGPRSLLGSEHHIRQSSCLRELVIITIKTVIIKKKRGKKRGEERM